MSISSEIAVKSLWLLRRTGLLDMTIQSPEEELEKARLWNRRHPFKMPKDHRAYYKEIEVAGYPVLLIRSRKKRQVKGKAILYLHGGMRNSWKEELSMARGYANHTGIEIWYPIYPSLTEVPVTKTIDVIFAVYQVMLRKYPAGRIAVMGCSFGGQYAFEVVNWNNKHGRPVPMPGLLIANSPGGVPDSEEDWRRMEKYAKSDPLIPVESMKMIMGVAGLLGEKIPKDALCPSYEDFHDAPETYVYYATETCAGNADAYLRAYESAGVSGKMHMHIEPGMMHGYSTAPVFPESRAAYEEQIRLLDLL